MHVVVIVVLDALVSEGGERHSGGVQPHHVGQQPLGRFAPGVPKLDLRVEGLLCDGGARMADKVEQQLLFVLNRRRSGKCSGTALRRDLCTEEEVFFTAEVMECSTRSLDSASTYNTRVAMFGFRMNWSTASLFSSVHDSSVRSGRATQLMNIFQQTGGRQTDRPTVYPYVLI